MTNTMPATKSAKTVSIECGRCAGTGKFWYNAGQSGVCYGCNGRKVITMTAAKHAEMIAMRADLAESQLEQAKIEAHEEASYQAASDAIATGGIDGAREFFKANRTDRHALYGLVGALRDANHQDEANAVVRFNNAR